MKEELIFNDPYNNLENMVFIIKITDYQKSQRTTKIKTICPLCKKEQPEIYFQSFIENIRQSRFFCRACVEKYSDKKREYYKKAVKNLRTWAEKNPEKEKQRLNKAIKTNRKLYRKANTYIPIVKRNLEKNSKRNQTGFRGVYKLTGCATYSAEFNFKKKRYRKCGFYTAKAAADWIEEQKQKIVIPQIEILEEKAVTNFAQYIEEKKQNNHDRKRL